MLKSNLYISLIAIFFIIMVSIQYTLNKIYKVLKDIRDIQRQQNIKDRF